MKSGDCVEKISNNVPIAGVFDVIVCGGGPAGCAAAIRSAREGAQTLLIEKQQSLGGIWTAGLMPWILDHQNKVGILTEIKEKLSERGGSALSAGVPEKFRRNASRCKGVGIQRRQSRFHRTHPTC